MYEVVASRIRYMQSELTRRIRILALATPLANAKDVANWLGIGFPLNTFNFHPSVRPVPLEIHIQGFDNNNKGTRVLAMERPAYNALKKHLPLSTDSQALIFLSDRKQVRLTVLDLLTFVQSDDQPRRFLSPAHPLNMKEVDSNLQEETLKRGLEYGIGFVHEGMRDTEVDLVKALYRDKKIRVLVVVEGMCWSIDDLECHLTIVLDAQKYEEHR